MKIKRRRFGSVIVEPLKQFKFGVYVAGISFIFIILGCWVFLEAFVEQYNQIAEIFKVVEGNNYSALLLNDVFYRNSLKVLILFGSFFCVILFMMFRLTHRYYGPLVSIERFVENFRSGNLSVRVHVRKKDELQRLAAKLNDMADKIEKSHS